MTSLIVLAAAVPAIWMQGLGQAGAPAVCVQTTYHKDGTISEQSVPDDGKGYKAAVGRSGDSVVQNSSDPAVAFNSSAAASHSEDSNKTASFRGKNGESITVTRKDGVCRIAITEP